MSQTVSDFNSRLTNILSKAEKVEPPDEYAKIRSAVARVIYDTGALLLYPIYRRHQGLMPDELRGELLLE
jgi:hypothetical protein